MLLNKLLNLYLITNTWKHLSTSSGRNDCILSPCLFNSYAEYIKRNARLDDHKLKSRLPGEVWETMETVTDFIFFWPSKSLQMVTAAMKLKDACCLEEKL